VTFSECVVPGFVRAGRVGLVALALIASVPAVTQGRNDAASEATVNADQVKAAFLFNFARFVEWSSAPADPLVIGVASDDSFADIVERLMRDRKVDGRPVVTRRLRDGDDPAGCHVLFISASRRGGATELLQRARGPILTVGENVQFLRDGGIIRFYVDDNRVRFQINRENATARGLKISSHLLNLGTR
jgi:hypothetical protein